MLCMDGVGLLLECAFIVVDIRKTGIYSDSGGCLGAAEGKCLLAGSRLTCYRVDLSVVSARLGVIKI